MLSVYLVLIRFIEEDKGDHFQEDFHERIELDDENIVIPDVSNEDDNIDITAEKTCVKNF